MTTSIYTNTVSPDLIITTPAQLVEAFRLAGLSNGVPLEEVEDYAPELARNLIGYLKQLNEA